MCKIREIVFGRIGSWLPTWSIRMWRQKSYRLPDSGVCFGEKCGESRYRFETGNGLLLDRKSIDSIVADFYTFAVTDWMLQSEAKSRVYEFTLLLDLKNTDSQNFGQRIEDYLSHVSFTYLFTDFVITSIMYRRNLKSTINLLPVVLSKRDKLRSASQGLILPQYEICILTSTQSYDFGIYSYNAT
jgi:hypothetical protein